MRKTSERPERLGWRDYFQIATTALMAVLGLSILWQTFFVGWAIPSLIFGTVLLLFSLFRIRMILAYFHQRRIRHDL
jgi:uncharacterized protein (DUF2062 family)